jgi:pimeloyl-ACP methyl ester carboxylesterase
MDRRGRGESGDSEIFALEREFEDVAAVVQSAGPVVDLFGHSYGALCAMEAALRVGNLRRLVLYEPAFGINGVDFYPPGTREKFQALLDRGERDQLLVDFFREIVGLSDGDIDLLRSDPSWHARLQAAHTVVREFADGDYRFQPERFRTLSVPTLMLLGELTPPSLTRPTREVAAALPDCRVVVMPGQGHVAMNTAPELLLKEVLSFLLD